ncbi:RNA polymerase II transcription factor B 52 kDa subunit [Saitozyma podzolica]|uniref:RNA polymerase II transcription factor B subunit 2 n=1 Tax=Saitozyma podzolica TaxID=1890683 RepID=A0A427YIG0_9TREE|nr:RNA polymerase II transcription factor B 52 kDa subunit [Saitozyma podzolica]
MVQPSFSHPRKAKVDSEGTSPTAALDAFLDTQHQSYFEELYRSEAVCLCILRLLPPVCRHIILHILWSHNPLRTIELKAFLQIDQTERNESLNEIVRPMLDRKILGGAHYQKNKTGWPLNDAFKRGLRNALTGLHVQLVRRTVRTHPSDLSPSVDDLIHHGETTWESILKYMVSSGLAGGLAAVRPRQQVLQLLHASGLMADPSDMSGRNPNYDRLTITSKGFQFLLEDRQTQLWQILMFYLNLREANEGRSAEILSLFFSLGCMQLGQGYSASQSFPRTQSTLEDLEQYGFIHRRPRNADGRKSDHFFPTHLATGLCSGDEGGGIGTAGTTGAGGSAGSTVLAKEAGEEKRFLILETNYKIYAYTSNELEIAILNLFVDIRIRYPNLVVGKLDRQNVKAAMEKGISAHQIISYLSSHAHSQMYNSPPPLLHPTIVDQLHLWDKERNRLKAEETVMFEFFSKELFDDTEAEARRYDGVQVALPEQKLLFVTPSIKDGIRDFVVGQQRQLRGA